MLPFREAVKLPIWIYGTVRILSLKGKIIIEGPIESRMIKMGINEEYMSSSKGCALLDIQGTVVFKGFTTFSINCCFKVEQDARIIIGEFSFFGNSSRIICTNEIILGSFFCLAFESQMFDTDFHYLKDSITGEIKSITSPIIMGHHNWIANRTTIMKGTKTPNYCTVASNSLLNKDYTKIYPTKIILAGVPASCVRTNKVRDFSPIEKKLNSYFKSPKTEIPYFTNPASEEDPEIMKNVFRLE